MKARTAMLVIALLAVGPAARALDVPQKRPPTEKRGPTEKVEPVQVEPKPTLHLPEDPRPFTDDPAADGIAISGIEQDLAPYAFLQVTFPEPLCPPELIDREDAVSPVVFWPDLDIGFVWRTPTSGDLTVRGPSIPQQEYRLRLRPGLTDLEGDPLPVDSWGALMHSPPLAVVDWHRTGGDSLPARPQVFAAFNYPIDLIGAATSAWFQDRETRKRFPAEVFLNRPPADSDAARTVDLPAPPPSDTSAVRFCPVQPLPPGRQIDFVIDGIRDAFAGRGLRYPFVKSLGRTEPLELEYVAARTPPLGKPEVTVKFSSRLDATTDLPERALEFSPPVPGLRLRVDGNTLIAEGEFEVPGRYQVVISDKILGASGYGLASPEKWGATFVQKRPGVIFPDRELRMRPALGLNFAFYQINTGPLDWRLAALPVDQLEAARERLREFDDSARGADGEPLRDEDGYVRDLPTEPLVDALGLDVVAQGTFPAPGGGEEVLRKIAWKSDNAPVPGGATLLEVTGRDSRGRLIGNRAIIFFGDLAVTRKEDPSGSDFRIARQSDGLPAEGATVSLLAPGGAIVLTRETGPGGVARFEAAEVAAAWGVLAEWNGQQAIQPFDLSERFPGGYLGWAPPPNLRGYLFTDRPLYRPGQMVHFKGFVRREENGTLEIPKGPGIAWEIRRGHSSEPIASGEAPLSDAGGWHDTWQPPEGLQPGSFSLEGKLGGVPFGDPVRFQIEEFRNPPFSVVCEPLEPTGPGESVLQVDSRYFHGAPNAGARVRWKATWLGDTDGNYPFLYDEKGMNRTDRFGPGSRAATFFAEAEGESAIGIDGRATIRCPAPFADNENRARAEVHWVVDVTGPDGQTIPAGTTQTVAMRPALLGVKALDTEPGIVHFEWDVESPFGPPPTEAVAELFRVETKTVRERLAPEVYRFRNFEEFRTVETTALDAPGRVSFSVPQPGRYVLAIDPAEGSGAMRVSAESILFGPGESDLPVESHHAARLLPLHPAERGPDGYWEIGETARIGVDAPSAGVAWVTVETDRVLDSFTLPLEGNASEVQIPVKAEYEPNAFVTVYLLRPGGEDALAGEMFGSETLRVRKPGRNLGITVELNASRIEPRKKISGRVVVHAMGAPVAGADLAVYAVDDALLSAGGWTLPRNITEAFLPWRRHEMVTYSALDGFVEGVQSDWLTQKGFVVGGGGEAEFGNAEFVRKEFKPLILWLPDLRTGPDGTAAFEAEAPDNLGRFRFIAVGQTPENQFGAADATVEVAKPLMIEPALPRFLREGDEVQLRALVRQDFLPEAGVAVSSQLDGPAELKLARPEVLAVKSDVPSVVNFPARVTGRGEVLASFLAETRAPGGETMSDAVQMPLPALPPAPPRPVAVMGQWEGRNASAASLAPEDWSAATGTFSLTLSTSPFFPRLLAARAILSYPHGCFEQQSGRLLALTQFGGFLQSLPDGESLLASRRPVIEESLTRMEASLLPGGFLPMWPGGGVPEPAVTIQCAQAVLAAEAAGFAVPGRLASELPEACRAILENRAPGSTPTLRVFAFHALANAGEVDAATAADLYLLRDRMTPAAKSLLAVTLAQHKLLPAESKTLLEEAGSAKPEDFDPATFSSTARTKIFRLWAELAANPADPVARKEFEALLDSVPDLSTQENLWVLAAMADLMPPAGGRRLPTSMKPKPALVSPDGTAATWGPLPLDQSAEFSVSGLPSKGSGTCLIEARVEPSDPMTPASGDTLRVSRIVKNLTDPKRVGTPEAPFQLGDELLISYRMASAEKRAFMALEDPLPSAIETLNPDVALFAALAPQENLGSALAPSFTALRDASTDLFFDQFPKGSSSAAILARVTAAGTFTWPGARLTPMYLPTVSGSSAASKIHVVSK